MSTSKYTRPADQTAKGIPHRFADATTPDSASGGSTRIQPSPPPREGLLSPHRRSSSGVRESNFKSGSPPGEVIRKTYLSRAGGEGEASEDSPAKPGSPVLPKGMTGELMRQVAALDMTRMSCDQVSSCVWGGAAEMSSTIHGTPTETVNQTVETPSNSPQCFKKRD